MKRHIPFLLLAAVATLVATVSLSAMAAVPKPGGMSARSASAHTSSRDPTLSTANTGTGAEPATPATGTETQTGTGTGKTFPVKAQTSVPGTLRVAPSASFGWPLNPRPHLHRRFEPPRSQWSRGHRGVDLRAAAGQPALSAGEGVVAFSGVVAGRGVVTVRHSGGLRTTYEPVDDRLAKGARVHRGTPIGVVSSTGGHCLPSACLHWGLISGTTYRDPLTLLGAFGPAVLLPLG